MVSSMVKDKNINHIKCQAWPRIVATAAKNNIGAPAARALLEEVKLSNGTPSLPLVYYFSFEFQG